MYERDNLLTVRLLVDRTPFLLPKQRRPFLSSREAAPEHPSTLLTNLVYETGLVKLFARPPCHPLPLMPPTCYPSLISPKDLHPLSWSPVLVLLCPLKTRLLVLVRERRLG